MVFVLFSCHRSVQESSEITALKAEAVNKLQIPDIPGAIAVYEKLIVLSPTDSTNYSNIGQLYAMMQEYELAERALKRAIEVNPNDLVARNNMGFLLFDLDRYDESRLHLEMVVKKDKKQTKALTMLGNICLNQNNLTEAMDYFDQAIAIDPGFSAALLLKGTVFAQQQKHDEAERLWNGLLLKDPLFVPVVEQLADLYNYRGQWDKLEVLLQKSIDLGIKDLSLYRRYGLLLVQQGKTDEAIRIFRIASTFSDKEPGILYHLAFLLLDNGGANEEARALLQQALPLNKSLRSYYLTGMAWAAVKRDEMAVAADFFQQAAAINDESDTSDRSLFHYYHGRYLLLQGKSSEALLEFKAVRDLDNSGHWKKVVEPEIDRLESNE